MANRDDKTEKATPRRRREARKKGESARSVELPQAVSMGVFVVMLPLVIERLTVVLMDTWNRSLALASTADVESALDTLGAGLVASGVAFAPVLLLVVVASAAAQAAVVGDRPNLARLKPQWKTLNPASGIKRLFSKQSLWELTRTSLKLGAVAVVVLLGWEAAAAAFVAGPRPIGAVISVIGAETARLIGRLALLAALVGIVDAVVARRRFDKNLRMSKQELKEENRQSEGDPIIKGEMRRRMTRMSRLRMMAEVARADVVVTNPTHIAVALRYSDGDAAPVVVAKGAGFVAQRIREEAEKHGVPIRRNVPLARALHASVEIGRQIPVELYRAVAEVLALVYRTRGRRAAA